MVKMVIDKSLVKRILLITLSNVGDIILTTPALRTLAKEYPAARIDVLVGPKGREIFEKDPAVYKLIIYDKSAPIAEKRRLQLKLKKLAYDLVVDLRNTLFPLLLGPKYRTATIQKFPLSERHSIDRHLYRLKSIGITSCVSKPYIHITSEDEVYIENALGKLGITLPMIVMNPGAKSHLKRWTAEGFAEVADRLILDGLAEVVFIGLKEDRSVVDSIRARMKKKAHDMVNTTTIRQLAALLKKAHLVITNDSAPLHLACAVGTKVLAIFGPTDPARYGPINEFDQVISVKLSCSPCEKAVCAHNYECMKLVSADMVFDAAKMMLEGYE